MSEEHCNPPGTEVAILLDEIGEHGRKPSEIPRPYCQDDPHEAVEYVWWNDTQTTVIYCAVIDGCVYTFLSSLGTKFDETHLISAIDLQLSATHDADESPVLYFAATCTDDNNMVAVAISVNIGWMEWQPEIHLYELRDGRYEPYDDAKSLEEAFDGFQVRNLLIEGSKLYITGFLTQLPDLEIVAYDIPQSKTGPTNALRTCLPDFRGCFADDEFPSVRLPAITTKNYFSTKDISLHRFYRSMQPCAIWRSDQVLVLFALATGRVIFTAPIAEDFEVLWTDRWHILLRQEHLDDGWNCQLLSVETGCLISSFKVPQSRFGSTGYCKCFVISDANDALLGKVLFMGKHSCSIWDMATGTEILTSNDLDNSDARFLRHTSKGCLLQNLFVQPDFNLKAETLNLQMFRLMISLYHILHGPVIAHGIQATQDKLNTLSLFYEPERGSKRFLVLKQVYVRSFEAGMLFAVAPNSLFIAWDTAKAKRNGSNSEDDYISWTFRAEAKIEGFTLEFRRSNPRYIQGSIELQGGRKISIPYANYLSQDLCVATPLQFSTYGDDQSSRSTSQDQQLNDRDDYGYFPTGSTDLLGYNTLLRLSFLESARLRGSHATEIYLNLDLMLPNRHNYLLAPEVGVIREALIREDRKFLHQYIRLCASTPIGYVFGCTIANDIAGLVRLLPELALIYSDIVALVLSTLRLSPTERESCQFYLASDYCVRSQELFKTRNPLFCFSVDMPSDPNPGDKSSVRNWIAGVLEHFVTRKNLCEPYVIPLHGICQYPPLGDPDVVDDWELHERTGFGRRFSTLIQRTTRFWVLTDDERSTYIKLVMLDDDILLKAKVFDSLYFEALNAFKWDTFAAWRYYFILVVHLIFYILLWVLGSLHVSMQTGFLIFDFSFIIAFTFVFLVQEARQFCAEGTRYVSFYNIIDLSTYSLALSVAVQGLQRDSADGQNSINTSVYSFAVLCSWIQFLLQLRSIRWLWMALLIDSIYRIVASLVGFWIVLAFTTFAFAYALWTQLLTREPR
ncbi:hypothetical protein BZG36_00475 [Bifiguratus adelaidae]|uniref:Uncharacterized protein n=1 Tax=Bifiguratus adelaidae TaxID=1938954 RepID=A0A261Y7D9_9FUNG|nr:hypothetical protein BZG36_00475 [Bifiguratus adelaidae]